MNFVQRSWINRFLAVLGNLSIGGTLTRVEELANILQVCLDSGAKKVLVPILSAADIGSVPPELMGKLNLKKH
ncbi:MAG: ATP-dependent Lon protease [Eubacteriaceae bacterium]|nr:ATP-dependent Lon protease [Eubacteriaceae bacterium]